LAAGGSRPELGAELEGGFFFEPTIFDGVNPSSVIAQEEIFGPVVSVLRFETIDGAIRIANDVRYGLAATVWTTDLRGAIRFANELEVGVVWTNWPHGGGWHVPYEGHKQSGFGEDLGLSAISTFTKLKVNNVNAAGVAVEW
jgi:acyl-CoA reductase-like NAD-dependent aldehyde dehydrogenase